MIKTAHIYRYLTGLLLLSLLFACNQDDCKSVVCQNGGNCFEGFCDCATGFTGEFCQDTIGTCDTVTCVNGGVCFFGECECPPGWDQPYCDVRTTSKFEGLYEIIETCDSTGINTFDVFVFQSGSINTRMFFDNLFGWDVLTYAEVIGTYTFFIPTQSFYGGTISGDGSIDPTGSNMFMNYYIDLPGATTISCTATLNRI